jgi:Ca-activated chloride channel family protein
MISGQKFQIRAAFLFLLTLASANAQQNVPLEKPKDRSEPVVLMVTALNEKGHDISGLQQSNFLVLEDKVAQTISSFSSRDEPTSVGIVLDASGSMRGDPPASSKRKRQLLTEALARFLELSNASNEYFVMGISSRPWLLLDWTSDRHVVIERVRSLEAKGITAL